MSFGAGNMRHARATELILARKLYKNTVLELGPPPWAEVDFPALLAASQPALTPERVLELSAIIERERAELEQARQVYAAEVAARGSPPWVRSLPELLTQKMPELASIERARELALELANVLEAEHAAADRAAALEARRLALEAAQASRDGDA